MPKYEIWSNWNFYNNIYYFIPLMLAEESVINSENKYAGLH